MIPPISVVPDKETEIDVLVFSNIPAKVCSNQSPYNSHLWDDDLSFMIVLGFNDTSTLVDHFVLSPREREKKRTDSRGDEREE